MVFYNWRSRFALSRALFFQKLFIITIENVSSSREDFMVGFGCCKKDVNPAGVGGRLFYVDAGFLFLQWKKEEMILLLPWTDTVPVNETL